MIPQFTRRRDFRRALLSHPFGYIYQPGRLTFQHTVKNKSKFKHIKGRIDYNFTNTRHGAGTLTGTNESK